MHLDDRLPDLCRARRRRHRCADPRGRPARRARHPTCHGRGATRPIARRSRDERGDGTGQDGGQEAARDRRRHRATAYRPARCRGGRGRRARVFKPAACAPRLDGRAPHHPARRCGLRPLDRRRGAAGQRRIRLRQPDRADAHGALPRGGRRRCAVEPARLCRLCCHARILHQRRRRAGRYPRPIGPPALPRGAWRRRDDPRGILPRRLSDPGRRGTRRRVRRCLCAAPRKRLADPVPVARRRDDDGPDPRRPCPTRNPSRRLHQRGGDRRRRRGGPGAGQPRRQGADLRRCSRTAQGGGTRRLGAGRADVVPREPVRRRPGSPGQEIRRRMDVFRHRHRQPRLEGRSCRRADRHLGSRPWRNGQAHGGCRHGTDRRPGASRRQARPDGPAVSCRRARQDEQAVGIVRDPCRCRARSGQGRRPLHHADQEGR